MGAHGDRFRPRPHFLLRTAPRHQHLLINKISRAAAEQRAGRAGRTAPGRAFRLWSQADHARRAEFEAPGSPSRRSGGSGAVAQSRRGFRNPDFRWFDAPAEAALVRAEHLLHDLGALDAAGPNRRRREDGIAAAGTAFSRLMLAGHEHGCVAETAFIAAAVQGEGVFAKTRRRGPQGFHFADDDSDFAGEWRAFDSAEAMRFDPKRCGQLGILARGARETARIRPPDARWRNVSAGTWQAGGFRARREAVGKAMLASFSDQLAIRFNQGTLACRLVGKRRGKLDEESCVKSAPPSLPRKSPKSRRGRSSSTCAAPLPSIPHGLRSCFRRTSASPMARHGTRRAAAWFRARKPASAIWCWRRSESDHEREPRQAAEILAAKRSMSR
jgi:HrpA-like RNA helicase